KPKAKSPRTYCGRVQRPVFLVQETPAFPVATFPTRQSDWLEEAILIATSLAAHRCFGGRKQRRVRGFEGDEFLLQPRRLLRQVPDTCCERPRSSMDLLSELDFLASQPVRQVP